MVTIDLHMHSHHSDDGDFSVQELLGLCAQAQVTHLSITDHNSVRAVPEALALARGMGLCVLSGVELDCTHMGRNFHLLGYHFDASRPVFDQIEQSILTQEQHAAQEKIERIQKQTGIPLAVEEVLTTAGGGVVTGELIAEILLQKEDAAHYAALSPYLPGGARADNPYVNFYWDYFSQGKPAYVPIQYLSLAEGVEILHAAGGIAVLAHPGQNLQGDYSWLDGLIKTGIDGIEAYSSYHNAQAATYFDHAAQQSKLLTTCGSDFHGKTKPSIPLCGHGAGTRMPGILEALQNRLGSHTADTDRS